MNELPKHHCQNGESLVCLAGNFDGVVCPWNSCDLDDDLRSLDTQVQAYLWVLAMQQKPVFFAYRERGCSPHEAYVLTIKIPEPDATAR